MKLWLDDIRPMPTDYDAHVTTAMEAIFYLKTNKISHISLDHDLGDDNHFGTGCDVANWIEESAYNGTLKKLTWYIHSANPVGRKRIEQALKNADEYWEKHKSINWGYRYENH